MTECMEASSQFAGEWHAHSTLQDYQRAHQQWVLNTAFGGIPHHLNFSLSSDSVLDLARYNVFYHLKF